MKQKIFTFIIAILLIISACQFKGQNSDIIEKEKFIKVLTDIHIADGVLADRKLHDRTLQDTSRSYYNYVFAKHKITREQVQKTLYYYAEHTQEFDQLYAQVVLDLNKKREELTKSANISGDLAKLHSINLWSQKTLWNIPEDGKKAAIRYKINTKTHGKYQLQAKIIMFVNDSSKNPRVTLQAHYSDNSLTNESKKIKKDGEWHNYVVTLKTNPNKQLVNISGWILDHSKFEGSKHAIVQNIELKRLPK